MDNETVFFRNGYVFPDGRKEFALHFDRVCYPIYCTADLKTEAYSDVVERLIYEPPIRRCRKRTLDTNPVDGPRL